MILRLLFLAALSAAIASCGFHPVYEKQRAGEATLNEVRVAAVPGRSGQIFRSHLEDLLNPQSEAADPRFEARVTLGVKLDALAIAADGTISTFRVLFSSKLAIVDIASGKIIHQESITRSNRYTVSSADYSTYVAENDAIEREAEALAEEHFLAIASFVKTYQGSDLSKAPVAPPLAPVHQMPPPGNSDALSMMHGPGLDATSTTGGIVTPNVPQASDTDAAVGGAGSSGAP